MSVPGLEDVRAAAPNLPAAQRRTLVLLLCALFAGLFLSLTMPVTDPDAWWHLATGRWIFEHRALPGADPFDFTSTVFGGTTQVRYLLTQSWLSQAALYGSYLAGGLTGVVLLRAAVFTGLFLCLYRLLRRSGAGALLAVLLLALAVQSLARELGYVADRPQMWSSLFFVALLLLLEDARAGKGWALAALPAFMLLWANLHGGYILGVVVLAIVATARLLSPGGGKRRLFASAAAAIILTGCNPAGYEALLSYPLQRLSGFGSALGAIFEEAPLFVYVKARTLPLTMPALTALLILPPLTCGLRLRSILRGRRDTLLIYLLTLGLGLKAVRYLAFLIPTACWVTALNIAAAREGLADAGAWRRLPTWLRQRSWAGAPAAAVALVALTASYGITASRTSVMSGARYRHEFEGAADFLQRNGVRGRLFNDYTAGGYLVWRLQPRMQVFIYGRMVYSELLGLYQEVLSNPTKTVSLTRTGEVRYFYQRVFEENAVDAVVIPAGDTRSGDIIPLSLVLAQDDDWALVHAEPGALVFLRRTPAHAPLLKNALPKSAVYDNLAAAARAVARSRHGQSVDVWQGSLAIAYSLSGRKREAFAIVEEHLRRVPGDTKALEFRDALLKELAAGK